MRKILAIGVALSALGCAPAFAADIPAKAPAYTAPAVVPVFNWTGFYIGGHVGGLWSRKELVQTFEGFGGPLDRTSNEPSGWLAGGQVGYNWQAGQWVFGVEADGSWADANGCGLFVIGGGARGCSEINWLGTVTGRLGWAFDRALIYAKGGVAFANENHFARDATGLVVTTSPRVTRTGWALGGGLEWAFSNNWSAKIEYNYLDFGTHNYEWVIIAPGLVERFDIHQRVQLVKFGINYRF